MKNDTIRTLLDEELNRQFDNLKGFETGSEEYAKVVDNIGKLYKLKIDEDNNLINEKTKMSQINNEDSFKYHQLNSDEEFKMKQLDRDERFRDNQMVRESFNQYLKIGVEIAGVILPLAFYASWMKKGFKFEETGTFTSTTFKGLFQKFKTAK